jgi:hypothetical protein
MQGTSYSDGVPGLTQKPIEPGASYIYRFKASPAGTYWSASDLSASFAFFPANTLCQVPFAHARDSLRWPLRGDLDQVRFWFLN